MSARLLVPAIRCLRELGIEPEALFDEAGAPKQGISDPDVRVSSDAMLRVLTLAAEQSGDPAFGLHAGQRLVPGDIGVLEYLVRTSVSPQEIVQKLTKYHRLAGNMLPQIERDGDRITVGLPHRDGYPRPPVLEEYNLSFWAKLARTIQGDDLRPHEVMFTHAKPAHADLAQHIFGAPVRFQCPNNGLIFGLESLAVPGASVDEGLSRAIGERADEALAALGTQQSICDRVRVQLRRQLRGGGVTADTVARALGMSARTLRRRLESEDVSFQSLRDAARKEWALEHMREPALSISDIAYLLGFAETSAFHRAFRRWTGTTPAEYRRNLTLAG